MVRPFSCFWRLSNNSSTSFCQAPSLLWLNKSINTFRIYILSSRFQSTEFMVILCDFYLSIVSDFQFADYLCDISLSKHYWKTIWLFSSPAYKKAAQNLFGKNRYRSWNCSGNKIVIDKVSLLYFQLLFFEGKSSSGNKCVLFSESTKQVIKSNGKISSFGITNGDVYSVVKTRDGIGAFRGKVWLPWFWLPWFWLHFLD